MADLTDFVLARLAEDEASARAAVDLRERVYVNDLEGTEHHYSWAWLTRFRPDSLWSSQQLDGCPTPDRVLADCEAKRRVVEMAQDSVKHRDEMRALMTRLGQEPGEAMHSYDGWTDGLLRAVTYLALPYSDHPDYRQEWAP